MKTIKDFMEGRNEHTALGGHLKILHVNGILYVANGTKHIEFQNNDELQDIVCEELKLEVRVCDHCGCPMDTGFTDDYADFYNCEDCFPKDMDERYGSGNWRECSEENEDGGFYEYLKDGEWQPEPSYYTEWNN